MGICGETVASKIISGAGTTQIKLGGGVLRSITVDIVGTGTIQLKDGPDSAGNFQALLGAAAITPTAVGPLFNPGRPLSFRDGLQIVTGGAGSEYEIQFD